MKRNMAYKDSFGLPLAVLFLASLGVSSPAAMAQMPATRLAGDWRSTAMVTIPARRPPLPPTATDLGAASSGVRLERMLLLLDPSPNLQQALIAEIENQQNSASPEYHHWLTPAAFADTYANSGADLAALVSWLQSQGLQVAPLPASRGWIEFSGTVAQVEQAFLTQINSVTTAGGPRFVLAGTVSVPAALAPLVHGLVSLDGALSSPALTTPRPMTSTAAELAAETSLSQAEALTPQLAAQLLHLDALQAAGVNGAGETVAIAARSNVFSGDIAAFRTAFGLPASALQVNPSGSDPGQTSDQVEATMAASWAGAAAPGAQIVLVPAATTSATDGLDLSLAAIIDQALAHTVAVGYSACEASLSEAHQAFYAALYRQAAAEGIAVIAATGDSGPAACHAAGSDAPVSTGYGVNALASTPWNTAVGVAAFGVSGPATGISAMAAWSPANAADPAYAGGGGGSTLYTAPSWQPVPAQPIAASTSATSPFRLLPDVALPAAVDSSVNPGLAFCLSDSAASNGCTLVRGGGSSAAIALFAGIAALVAEKYGAQGNLAPNLYALSRVNGIFNDVQQGSAQLRCAAASPGCGATEKIGYNADDGYDLATGLGAVNAQALVTQWKARPLFGTDAVNVSLTVSPTEPNSTYNPSATVALTATVVSLTGHGTPTGSVIFHDNSTGANLSSSSYTLNSSGTASLTTEGNFGIGGNNLVAIYSGDGTYAPLTMPTPLNINMQLSTTSLAIVPSNYSPASGDTITVTASCTAVTPPAGSVPPVGLVTLNLDGVPTTAAQLSTTGGITTATFSLLIPVNSTLHTHDLQAIYAGDATNYSGSTAPQISINVAQSATTSVVVPATTTPYVGSTLSLSATVTAHAGGASAPTGTFAFTVDGVTQGTAALVPGTPSTATLGITVPSSGSHTVGGAYSGDSFNAVSTATPVSITVAKGPTTLAVLPASTSPAPGATFQVTVTIATSYTSAVLPTGTVTLSMDGANQGSVSVVSGTTATFTITAPTSGTHTLQAAYGGDGNFNSSTSSSVSFTVAKVTTTVLITPATVTPALGSSLVVSASVSASSLGSTQPSGTVTFTLDGTSVGTGNLSPGSPSTTSVTITSIGPGTHTLLGTYSGDSYYNNSVSTSVSITVGKSPTTLVLVPATLTPTAGTSLVVTASITATTPGSTQPTGSVSFTMDGVSLGLANVASGSPSTASFTIPPITAGSHILAGSYSGDSNYNSSTASTVTIVASKGTTVTTVSATPPILAAGVTETLTATIAPYSGITGTLYTITGTVSFYDGGSTLLGTAVISSNIATLSGVNIANNVSHSITAIYSGDTNWLPSTSIALPMAATTLPDHVVLTSNLSTVAPGQALILTATVTPNSAPAVGAEQNPTGNVIFYNGTIEIGEVALSATPLSDSSTATITTQTLPGGQDTITAFYVGDLYYNPGTSNALSLVIQNFTITPSPSNPATNLTIVKGSAGSAAFIITGLGGFNNEVQIVCAVIPQDDMTCTATPQQVVPTATVTFVVQTFTTGGPASTVANNHSEPLWPRAIGGTALALLAFFLLPFGRKARIFTGRSTRRFLVLLLLLVGLGGAGIGCNNVSTPLSSQGTPLGVATLKITASAYVDNTVVSQSTYLTVNVVTPGSVTP